MGGEYQTEVLAKTPGLYQVPKLRNLKSGKILDILLSSSLSLSSTSSSSSSSSSSASSSRIMGKYQKKILAKTPALYQVPKLRNLKSGKILNKQTDRPTDRQIFLICVITPC